MLKLKVITTTTRPGRRGPVVGAWITEVAKASTGFEVELLDLGEINLPMLDEPAHPRLQKYEHAHTRKWSKTIAAADAFILVTAEYNHGYPAPIKNALDYLYLEWGYKPVAFISYGGVSGGTRAVQMLTPTLTTLRMVPVVETVAVPFFEQYINHEGLFVASEKSTKAAERMLKELVRWAEVLKPFRGEQQ